MHILYSYLCSDAQHDDIQASVICSQRQKSDLRRSEASKEHENSTMHNGQGVRGGRQKEKRNGEGLVISTIVRCNHEIQKQHKSSHPSKSILTIAPQPRR